MRGGISLAGYFGFGNAGDELISRAVRAAAPELPWRGFQRTNPFPLFRAEALLFGGGELFQTRTSLRSFFAYAALPFLARAAGARFLAYGMGLDPSLPGWARRAAAASLNRADRVWFRDEESAEIFRASGGRAPHAVVPDPVWSLPFPPDERRPADVRRGDGGGDRNILWILRDPASPGHLPEKGGVLFLHPAKDAKTFGRPPSLEPWTALDDLLPLIRRYDAVVTMRYHGLVLAALAGVPAVALSSHGKVANLARELGAPTAALGDDPTEPMRRAFEGRDAFFTRARALRERAREGLKELAAALRSP